MGVVALRETIKEMDEILGYKNESLLKRYMADAGVDRSEAEHRFGGLKQFLYLCAVTPGYKVTSDAIDSMWHTFLLFTKDYRDFCQNYLGRFLDHEPFENASPENYVMTRQRATELFGELDAKLWPENAKADCSSGCGT